MNFLFLFSLFFWSAIFSYFLIKFIIFIFTKYQILDRPHLYKSEKWRDPKPYGVGIMLFLTLLISSPFVFLFGWFNELLEKRFLIFLLVGAIISVISFVDDMDTIAKSKIKIPPIFRLGMQILVGVIMGLTSFKIAYVSNLFGGLFHLDDPTWQIELWGYTINYFSIFVTIFWYVLIFNAVNFSDWVPGITGWFAFISLLILGILAIKLYFFDNFSIAHQENSRFILTILAIILPAVFWLTKADIRRDVIMGDSGTIMLAFCIATLAIIAWGKIATTISVLGIYLVDAIYVVMLRLKKWQNPMKWDQTSHLHFRLLEIGLSKNQVRSIVYFLTVIFGISAIFLSTFGKIILFIMIVVVTVFLTEILTLLQPKNKNHR